MNTKLTQNESARIWQMKAWAVVMVICAHCASVQPDAPAASQAASRLLQSAGSLGVPVFFFLAGYVFRNKPMLPWLKGKATGLLVPWVTTGVMVYLYVYLRKGGLSLHSLLLWLAGDGSYLWYLTVTAGLLLWSKCIFWGIEKGFWKLSAAGVFCLLVSGVMLLLERLGIVSFHPYLNIFRWLWLYVLGLLSGKYALVGRAADHAVLILPGSLALAVLALRGWSVTYWSAWFPLWACLTIVTTMNACFPAGKMADRMKSLGRDSFAIYLLHMPVAGVVVNLCGRVPDHSGFLTLCRPAVVLCITYGGIYLLKKVGTALRCEKTFCVLFGFRSGRGNNE